ncbi:MAG: CHASE2 domain-containing protein [Epsilonproteobacteria bacterium]|nr:CHASE2 domain-containing protein [Campylobacterota bacterium]
MKSIIKKTAFSVFISFTVIFYFIIFENQNFIKYIDYKFYDAISFILKKDSKNESSNCVVVDIDEESMNVLGQWPWPRLVMANLIDKIGSYYPSIIGLDILFPNRDRTSPLEIERFYKDFFKININVSNVPEYMKDNDKIFASSLKRNGVVLPIYLSNKNFGGDCEDIIYPKKKVPPFFVNDPIKSAFMLCNYPILQKSVEDFGFLNVSIDEDGIFRRIPLFMEYKNFLIPSFPLSLLLSLDNLKIEGENRVSVLGHSIKMDDKSRVLLNFNSPIAKTISAVDILRGEADPELFKGKIVIVGSSAIGLYRSYMNDFHEKVSGIRIYTTMIDNILDNSLYVQPEYFKKLNIFIAFVFSLLISYFLFKRWYIMILSVFLGATFFSAASLIYMYDRNVYISIGYFWTPFVIYFFFVSLLFAVINHIEKRYFYKELAKSHSAALESITLVAAMRDDETGGHLIRTKNYIKLLAQYLYDKRLYRKYLNPKFIKLLYEAAPLHDIGKVGIPDHILKKRGPFTKEEYEIMKRHTILGKEMIEKAMKNYDKNEFLQIACSIAYHHHEKWDGSGYPQGLKGDEIPIEGQLMAIADVYDALISKRVYKDAYSYEDAEALIIKESGKAFNPVLVEAFKNLRYEFRKIGEKYKEKERRVAEDKKPIYSKA